jgi:hypothetical protein
MVIKSHHHLEIPRSCKHKRVLALSRLPEIMVKLVGKLPGTDALQVSSQHSMTRQVA